MPNDYSMYQMTPSELLTYQADVPSSYLRTMNMPIYRAMMGVDSLTASVYINQPGSARYFIANSTVHMARSYLQGQVGFWPRFNFVTMDTPDGIWLPAGTMTIIFSLHSFYDVDQSTSGDHLNILQTGTSTSKARSGNWTTSYEGPTRDFYLSFTLEETRASCGKLRTRDICSTSPCVWCDAANTCGQSQIPCPACNKTCSHGSCTVNARGVSYCKCEVGYAGDTCDAPTVCGLNCGAHGSCILYGDQSQFSHCKCETGYRGETCDSAVCSLDCNSKGYCQVDYSTSAPTFSCLCSTGRNGTHCEIETAAPIIISSTGDGGNTGGHHDDGSGGGSNLPLILGVVFGVLGFIILVGACVWFQRKQRTHDGHALLQNDVGGYQPPRV